MKKKAIFLDRDGTINKEVQYLNNIDDLVLLPNSAKAIKEFKKMGFLIIVVTNQSAVARRYLTLEGLEKINYEMKKRLKKEGARIDDIFICPHHPDESCDCRKPKTGLIDQAVKKYNIDVKQSFVIGDKMADILLGRNAGCQSILVRTGYGREFENLIDPDKEIAVDDLLEAVKILTNN